LPNVGHPCNDAGMTHIDVPPGRAAQSIWCDRNWHDGTCCPGSIRQWHQDHGLLPPEPVPDIHEGHDVTKYSTVAQCATCDTYWTLPRPEWLGTDR
jgi:hypothetical protein